MAELTEVIRNRRPSCIGPNLNWKKRGEWRGVWRM
jgi:hypothetical protein